jgi:hypothetical protein
MRALVHVGLAVVITLAPVFCCCKVLGSGAGAHAAPAPAPPATPRPVESCCAPAAKPHKSCCDEIEEPAPTPDDQPAAPKSPASCACCAERPTAAQTESKPQVAAAEPTGEILPPAHFALAAGLPAHSGLFRGLHPPDFAGADARFEALFLRHTLRC